MSKQIPICTECGGDDIRQSLGFVWDIETQQWVSTGGEPIYDCGECGDVDIEFVEKVIDKRNSL